MRKHYLKEDEVEEVKTEPEQEPEPEKVQVFGVVDGCTKLYVRKYPNTNSEQVTIVDAGVKLLIDMENSTSDFYKVCTPSGAEGYCVKTFIKIDK